jgi:hypothetical protein
MAYLSFAPVGAKQHAKTHIRLIMAAFIASAKRSTQLETRDGARSRYPSRAGLVSVMNMQQSAAFVPQTGPLALTQFAL